MLGQQDATEGMMALQALERLTFQRLSVRATCLGQARVLAFFYWFTYTILRSAKPRFQPMTAAAES